VESVRCLPRALCQAALVQVLQHDLDQVLIAPSAKQAGSELAQHGEVEAWIAKLQAEGVFQVDPAAHRLDRLPVGQVLEELKDGDHGQAPRGYRQLAASVIQAGEHLVIVQSHLITDPHQQVALAERYTGNPGGLVGNKLNRCCMHRHRLPPPGGVPCLNKLISPND
jgi:hypothetical protein